MGQLKHIQTAMILAAGFGSRMGDLTAHRPKVLLPLNGITLLEVLVHRFRKAGIRRVVVNAHHQRHVLRRFVHQRDWQGVELLLSEEETLLGTGGGIAYAEPHFQGQTILVANGDVLCDLSLPAFEAAFLASEALAAMAVVPSRDSKLYSLVHYTAEGELLGFFPRGNTPPPGARTGIFTGFHLLTPAARAYLTPRPESIIQAFYRRALQERQSIFIFQHSGRWVDLGTRELYLAVRRQIRNGDLDLNPFLEPVSETNG